jgi:hypothetical protein
MVLQNMDWRCNWPGHPTRQDGSEVHHVYGCKNVIGLPKVHWKMCEECYQTKKPMHW